MPASYRRVPEAPRRTDRRRRPATRRMVVHECSEFPESGYRIRDHGRRSKISLVSATLAPSGSGSRPRLEDFVPSEPRAHAHGHVFIRPPGTVPRGANRKRLTLGLRIRARSASRSTGRSGRSNTSSASRRPSLPSATTGRARWPIGLEKLQVRHSSPAGSGWRMSHESGPFPPIVPRSPKSSLGPVAP